MEYFHSPGLSTWYSLLGLDADEQKAQAGAEGENRKPLKKKLKNKKVHILRARIKTGGCIG